MMSLRCASLGSALGSVMVCRHALAHNIHCAIPVNRHLRDDAAMLAVQIERRCQGGAEDARNHAHWSCHSCQHPIAGPFLPHPRTHTASLLSSSCNPNRHAGRHWLCNSYPQVNTQFLGMTLGTHCFNCASCCRTPLWSRPARYRSARAPPTPLHAE